MRPGLGWTGLAHLDAFVRKGGVLITTDDTVQFAVAFGLAQGVSASQSQRLKAPGTVVRSKFTDLASPIAYGYSENLSVYISNALTLGIGNFAGSRGFGRWGSDTNERATGRGTADDPDTPQGRPVAEAPEQPKAEPWQAMPVTDEQLRNGINVIPPAQRPRVVLRFGDARDLLVSGLLDGGAEIAQRPAVVDVPHDKGHVVLFSPNPVWRGETQATYFLVFNAILNFDSLDTGRKVDEK
jgi:hypothetical protein